MRTFMKIALAAVSLAATPTMAQSPMPHDGAKPSDQTTPPPPPMTGSTEEKLAKCKAMAPSKSMNDPACIEAMKEKPPATKEGGADNHNGTPHGAPPKTQP